MGLRINTNMASLKANKATRDNTREIEDTFAKLSSGERISKSSDDAAGLAISENFKGQIRGFKMAGRNAQNAISMVQVGEGGLQEITNNLVRLRELAIQAASDNIGDDERQFINLEFQNLLEENQRITQTTRFGRVPILSGQGEEMEFQVGIYADEFEDRIKYDASVINANNDELGVDGANVESKDDARSTLENIDGGIQKVASYRAILGAVQSRLQSAVSFADVANENLSAANSRIRDADYAEETSKLASQSIKQQASIAVSSQANNATALALRLLG